MGRVLQVMHALVTFCLLIWIALPMVPLVLSSVSAGWFWPDLIPIKFSAGAWHYVFSSNGGTWKAVATSMGIAMAVTLINLVLALPAADALARYSFPGKALVEMLLYAPLLIPPFVSTMGLYLTFIRLGLTDTVLGVIIAHVSPTLPYLLRALIVSFKTLGFQWEEQARMLGAGRWQRFRHVVLPHVMPGIVAGASLSMLVSLSQYLVTFLVGGGQVMTLPLLMFPFLSGGDQSVAAAYTILYAGMSILALWMLDGLLKRYYIKKLRVDR